ncbi:MAG TPA: M3 family oligoendopeptidase [Chloroflexota bacterium]|nr:M3 family oligoendopeptidase [Chloroflexota bacterium]
MTTAVVTANVTANVTPNATADATRLPHWDMSRIFPGLESEPFATAFSGVVEGVKELVQLYDRYEVRRRETHAPLDKETVAEVEEVIERTNELGDRLRTVYAYLHGFVSTNSRNELAQAKVSELQGHAVALRTLGTRFDAWVGSLDVEALIERSRLAREHAFPLRKASQAAHRQMSEKEEELAAALNLSAGTQWAKLHNNVTSQLSVTVPFPKSAGGERAGTTQELPMSAVRGLAHDPDRATRRAAYEAEMKAWERVAVPLAAAMNGIKGEVRTIALRRGWKDALEPMLFVNNIDQKTLDAMHEACRESFPDWRRYLNAKAKLLGIEGSLPWYDMFAPVGGERSRRWSFDEAADFVVEQFGTYSDKLAGLAQRALDERWIDAEPRDGKGDGAFCMQIRKDESGVLLNFEPSFNSVSTLAHELGHAYHNTCLAERTPMQKDTPMALAETASIFCQTIITNAALARATGAEKLAILEGELQNGCQVVVDIHSRFLFETWVFEKRAQRELSVSELNELMLKSQRETYGDGLDESVLHPAMWAVKSHYYSTGRSFYNWPYTFGQLFGQGLYARYREDPERFRGSYDDLLSSTGLHGAHELGQRFGIDFSSVDFWRGSLDVNREQIRQFEALAAAG